MDKRYVVRQLHPYQVMRVEKESSTAGGKGLNVARVAALAGEPVRAMGFVGGYNGELFLSLIRDPHITPDFTRTKAETRCCINVCESGTDRSTEFLEAGKPVEAQELARFERDFRERLPLADVVTISGSLPAGVPSEFYRGLIGLAAGAGKRVILDTSGGALRAALSARPTLVKPNLEELEQLLHTKLETREEQRDAAWRLHRQGIPMVAVSLGRHGALFACGEGVFHGLPPRVEAVNTVGCGDSMVAGFAIAMLRGLEPREMIRFAVALSSANAMTLETGSFRPKDLEWLLTRVTVEQIA